MQQETPNLDDSHETTAPASAPDRRGVVVVCFVVMAIVMIVVGLACPEASGRAIVGILKAFGLVLRAL